MGFLNFSGEKNVLKFMFSRFKNYLNFSITKVFDDHKGCRRKMHRLFTLNKIKADDFKKKKLKCVWVLNVGQACCSICPSHASMTLYFFLVLITFFFFLYFIIFFLNKFIKIIIQLYHYF